MKNLSKLVRIVLFTAFLVISVTGILAPGAFMVCMALILPGSGVADIRGSIGGTTYSRNRYGNYARNRTIPVNPNTPLQQQIRSAISVARDAWFNTLTAAQRSDWGVYAANVAMTNRLGSTIYLTGFNHFCRSALAAIYNGIDVVTDAPVEYALPPQDETFAIVASEATQTVAVTFDEGAAWVGEDDAYMLIYTSRPQNPTVNFFKGPYQLAGSIAGNSSTPPTTGATVNSPFTFAAGQKLFAQARIMRADGRLSEPFRVGIAAVA